MVTKLFHVELFVDIKQSIVQSFENNFFTDRTEIIFPLHLLPESHGWGLLFNTLKLLKPASLSKTK